jgi:hypothetical protein
LKRNYIWGVREQKLVNRADLGKIEAMGHSECLFLFTEPEGPSYTERAQRDPSRCEYSTSRRMLETQPSDFLVMT